MSISKKITLVAANFMILFFSFVPAAFAEEATKAFKDASGLKDPMYYIAAGIAIGIAACGCGIGQGRAAAGALEGIARNPNAYGKIFTPMIIALALIESLSIYALLVSLLAIFA